MFNQEIRYSISLLRPYLYPNATSPTRVPAGSNTVICYNTHQSSRGVLATVVNLVHLYMHLVISDEVGIL